VTLFLQSRLPCLQNAARYVPFFAPRRAKKTIITMRLSTTFPRRRRGNAGSGARSCRKQLKSERKKALTMEENISSQLLLLQSSLMMDKWVFGIERANHVWRIMIG
jgi:hypothetical protein